MEGKTLRRCVVIGLVFVMTGCGIPGPDGPTDSFGLDLTPPQNTPTRDIQGAVVFLVDGLNARIFEDMLTAGELPTFQKYFVDRGLYAPRAVANIPSVTLSNLTSIVTGQFSGHHGIMGINWFDRKTSLFRDYHTIEQKSTLDNDCVSPMLYQSFPDDFTVSIFYEPHRGASKFFENWLSAGPPFAFGWYLFVDRITLFRFGEMMDLARHRGKFPRLVCAYVLAPDFLAYQYGISNGHYRDAIRHADRQIGRVLGDFERAGVLDKLLLAVVSDHSHSDVKQHFDLTKFLEKKLGCPIPRRRLCDATPQAHREAYYDKFNIVVAGSGERYRAISLRAVVPAQEQGKQPAYAPWPVRPVFDDGPMFTTLGKNPPSPPVQKIDVLKPLLAQPAVDAVVWPTGKDCVRVATRVGIVEFKKTPGKSETIRYRAILGDDPLGYREAMKRYKKEKTAEQQAPTSTPSPNEDRKEKDKGVALTPREWLEVTCETKYPDLPAQILAYFRSPRAGDMVVFAAPGWDFGGMHKGGHGGIRAYEDMHVPLLLAGPGVPHTRVHVARTVDLAPTLLQLLGKPVPSNYDGQSLLPTTRPSE